MKDNCKKIHNLYQYLTGEISFYDKKSYDDIEFEKINDVYQKFCELSRDIDENQVLYRMYLARKYNLDFISKVTETGFAYAKKDEQILLYDDSTKELKESSHNINFIETIYGDVIIAKLKGDTVFSVIHKDETVKMKKVSLSLRFGEHGQAYFDRGVTPRRICLLSPQGEIIGKESGYINFRETGSDVFQVQEENDRGESIHYLIKNTPGKEELVNSQTYKSLSKPAQGFMIGEVSESEYYYVDFDGNHANAENPYYKAGDFHNDVAIVAHEEGKYFLIDKNFEPLVYTTVLDANNNEIKEPETFHSIEYHEDAGVYSVRKSLGGEYLIMNAQGELLAQPGSGFENLFGVYKDNVVISFTGEYDENGTYVNHYEVKDYFGKHIIEGSFSDLPKVFEGGFVCPNGRHRNRRPCCFLYNFDRTKIIDDEIYLDDIEYVDGCYIVKKTHDNNTYLLDSHGNPVIDEGFLDITHIGFGIFQLVGNDFPYIRKDGTFLIHCDRVRELRYKKDGIFIFRSIDTTYCVNSMTNKVVYSYPDISRDSGYVDDGFIYVGNGIDPSYWINYDGERLGE